VAALYADEDFPKPVVTALRTLGHDVLTAQEDGRGSQGIPDPLVLARATALGRAVLTNNRRHFIRLHRLAPNHAGIVACKEDRDVAALAARIHAAASAAPTLSGQLVRITRPGPRAGP